MNHHEDTKSTKKSRKGNTRARAGMRLRSCPLGILCVFLVSSSSGCQQKMADQPSYHPLQPSAFFDDGRSARPLVAGTIPYQETPEVPAVAAGLAAYADKATTPLEEYVTAFPFAISKEDLERGRERYTIF